MSADAHCVNCDQLAGSRHGVEFTAENGVERRLDITLCEECAEAIDATDWATVDAYPTESTEPGV